MSENSPPQARAWGWPVGIVVGLGLVVVANAIMISIALSNPSTPAASDHWAESLDWDRELDLRERSAALGWSVATIAWSNADRNGVELLLVDAHERPLIGLRGSVALERSDSAEQDVRLELRELGDGRYAAGPVPASRGLVRSTVDVEDRHGERFMTRQQIALDELPVIDNDGSS